MISIIVNSSLYSYSEQFTQNDESATSDFLSKDRYNVDSIKF